MSAIEDGLPETPEPMPLLTDAKIRRIARYRDDTFYIMEDVARAQRDLDLQVLAAEREAGKALAVAVKDATQHWHVERILEEIEAVLTTWERRDHGTAEVNNPVH